MDKVTAKAIADTNEHITRIYKILTEEFGSERTLRENADTAQSERTDDAETAMCELDVNYADSVSDLETAVCELSELVTGGN